ncbi:MAG: riboflavin synthase subunit beta [Flavobacteriales bacterium]|nr:riboflavin synthase subunit beta [Flavobacteriales bacterium]PIV92934.1 MAG: riboflavin synthase subunit beta [Flavobacteriaceae bacterium CG17_big_fil_post_rev_8_21_14_2_50_33_15]PJB19667.1 MAG: riboflavin synthase subunit beta [Flavobacteriaceae bacterium CG_4_9_14_3_um_filter_33_16]NCP52741.1 riboflavin synthase subunit beta [Flavobacteriales bacterium]NCP60216.1 riboflavin synthase subunit beta [Flavobacteriales bacterium]
MGLFKLRKNKKFSYTPRHFDDKGEGNPFEIKHKFDDFRKTVGNNSGLKTKWNHAFDDFKNSPDKTANRRIIIIIGILILVFLFIIDFDLSIFFPKK